MIKYPKINCKVEIKDEESSSNIIYLSGKQSKGLFKKFSSNTEGLLIYSDYINNEKKIYQIAGKWEDDGNKIRTEVFKNIYKKVKENDQLDEIQNLKPIDNYNEDEFHVFVDEIMKSYEDIETVEL